MARTNYEVQSTWDGRPLSAAEFARLELELEPAASRIRVDIEAAYHGDPRPEISPGRCPGLWNFEVVELFLVGKGERYLELEFGPHGHFLALLFEGVRHVVEGEIALDYESEIHEGRWRGTATVDRRFVPAPIVAANLFAIHGEDSQAASRDPDLDVGERDESTGRRYLAAFPLPGDLPDFHQPSVYPPVRWEASGSAG